MHDAVESPAESRIASVRDVLGRYGFSVFLAWAGCFLAASLVADPWAIDPGPVGATVALCWLAWSVSPLVAWAVVEERRRALRAARSSETRRGLRVAMSWVSSAAAAIVVTVVAASGLVIQTSAIHATDGVETTTHVRVLPRGLGYAVTGRLAYGTARRLAEIVDVNPGGGWLHLASSGGLVSEGMALAALVRERGLSTVVSTYCVSACTDAFVAGSERIVSPRAALGFHSAYRQLLWWSWRIETPGSRELYERAGVDEAFRIKAETTSPDDMWFPKAEEAVAARFATRVEPSSSLPDPVEAVGGGGRDWMRDIVYRHRWDADALSILAPGALAAMVDWRFAARRDARPITAATAVSDDWMDRLVAYRLADADPAVLREAATRMLAAMRELGKGKDADCRRLGAMGSLSMAGDVVKPRDDEYRPYTWILLRTASRGLDYAWPADVPPLPDVGSEGTWAPRGEAPGTCAGHVAWYAAALAEADDAGLPRIREHLRRVVREGMSVPEGIGAL